MNPGRPKIYLEQAERIGAKKSGSIIVLLPRGGLTG